VGRGVSVGIGVSVGAGKGVFVAGTAVGGTAVGATAGVWPANDPQLENRNAIKIHTTADSLRDMLISFLCEFA